MERRCAPLLRLSLMLTMARKHSHVADHAIIKMQKNSTNNEIESWLLKMHDFDTILYDISDPAGWTEDARIQSSVDPVHRVIDQQRLRHPYGWRNRRSNVDVLRLSAITIHNDVMKPRDDE